jgi:hypothetical protein
VDWEQDAPMIVPQGVRQVYLLYLREDFRVRNALLRTWGL